MESQCKICSNPYDIDKYVPMILCKAQHYCCLSCSEEILSTELLRRKCPDCRTTITKATVVKFRHYTNLLEQAKTQERKIETLESSANLLPQYRETIEFISSYDGKENQQYYSFLRTTTENMIEQKKYSAAKTVLKGMIENHPNSALYPFLGIGAIEEEKGLSEECNISWHKMRARQGPLSAQDLLNFIFLQNFNYLQQKQWYERLLFTHPQNIRLIYGLALTQHNSSNFSKALELYRLLVKLYPSFSKSFQMIAFIHARLNNQAQAVKFAKLCLQRQEKNIFALYIISTIEDKESLNAVTQIQPTYVRALNRMGLDQMNNFHYTRAQEIFKKCCDYNPHYIKPFFNLAYANIQLRDFKPVIQLINMILKKMLTSWEKSICYYLMGVADNKLGNIEASIDYLKRSIKQSPKNKKSMLTLAQIYIERGESHLAIVVYQSYLTQDPSSPYVYSQIVTCYQRIDNNELALRYINEWLKVEPQNVTIKSLLAEIHFKDGNWADAMQYYLKCFKLDYKKNIFYENVIQCLQKLKQFEEALKYVGEFLLHRDPSSDQYNRIIKKASDINQARNKHLCNK